VIASPSAEDIAAAIPLAAIRPADLVPMRAKGMAHAHWRIAGRSLVVRVPRWSQIDLDPAANLTNEATAFRRGHASGHLPRLDAVVAPSARLPMGALIVAEIRGRPPRVPEDMPAVARALAAIHSLPLPPIGLRAPLADPADPILATVALIERQSTRIDAADLAAVTRDRLRAEMAWAATLGSEGPPTALVGTDVHPGNFLLDPQEKAWFVDPERMQYGHPALDLAHATIDTSTRFDPDIDAVMGEEDVAAFLAEWTSAMPRDVAAGAMALFPTARRLIRLRTLVWMARWKTEGARLYGSAIEPDVKAHVDRVIDMMLA
jgi:aminoglycoside phosphotransferase (APT) family kinase protein